MPNGTIRWLVRTPRAMGGGREYCLSKGDAETRIKSFRHSANSAIKEFTALHSSEQAMLLGLVAQFDGDVRQLKSAADAGAGQLPTTQTVDKAVAAFDADHHAGATRKRNLMHILNRFALKFGEGIVSGIDSVPIERWMNGYEWGPKMHNDARQAISQFWKYCIRRKWAVTSPVTDIPVRKAPRSIVPIYSPEEMEALLTGLENEASGLIPAIVLSGFAGLRLTETARLSCDQVRAAMEIGHLEVKTWQAGKTLESRIVPIRPNLKAWLLKYLPETGLALPARWMLPTKTKLNRMDELGRYISRKTGCEWKSNALRHSYGTYRFKIIGDVAQVVDEMGTSIRNFEKHYRNRSKLVTKETAKEFFTLRP